MKYDNDRLGAALKLYLGTDPLPMHMPGGKRINVCVINLAALGKASLRIGIY